MSLESSSKDRSKIERDVCPFHSVRLQFGRCSVRTMFPMALEVLRNNRELFDRFVEHSVPIDEAVRYYELFEKGRIGKTVFNLADD